MLCCWQCAHAGVVATNKPAVVDVLADGASDAAGAPGRFPWAVTFVGVFTVCLAAVYQQQGHQQPLCSRRQCLCGLGGKLSK